MSNSVNNSGDGQSATSSFEDQDDNFLGGSSSLSNSYCTEWEKLFKKPGYMKSLRQYGMQGKLRCSRFRSVCWKLYLEVLPENLSDWTSKSREWRKRYDDLKTQLIINPRGAEAKDLSINNPLSQEVESPWNQFFLDNELRLTIKQDVIRTYPKIEFYHRDSIRTMMVDILFVYAKLRPDISYRQVREARIVKHCTRGMNVFYNDTTMQEKMADILFCYARKHPRVTYKQGMHELLAPLIFILHCDHQAFLHACDLESVSELTKEILDPQYLEHDAYSLFYQIMETMESCYVSKEMPPVMKAGTVLQSQPFVRPQDLHPSNVIVTKLTRIQDYLLKRFDFDLYEYLQKMDIAPQIYGIRWVRLLFGREFPMQDLLLLWDAIFADSISFDLVDYIFLAMLLYLRDAMLTSDYPSCLHLLMKYPPVSDIQYFINKALYLRAPHDIASLPDYQYQKPVNFGLNGWEYVPNYGCSAQMTQSTTSNTRRPGSLIIGGTKMSKSNSEPMNLITDTATSPTGAASKATHRKSSTVSLSHVESSLMRGSGSTSVRTSGTPAGAANQSFVRVETSANGVRWDSGTATNGVVEQMSIASSDGDTSSPHSSKFFVFGARGGRKTSINAKQKQQMKNWEQDAMKALNCIGDMESMCRRCAVELDVHIGTLQRQMLKQDSTCDDDEVLLALAGVKQVRDVLKGVLKPSCVFDSPESLTAHESEAYNSVTRRQTGSSTHSSQSATPIYEVAGGDQYSQHEKYYLATPDLLSSDANSPDGLTPCSFGSNRNPSDDTIVAVSERGDESEDDRKRNNGGISIRPSGVQHNGGADAFNKGIALSGAAEVEMGEIKKAVKLGRGTPYTTSSEQAGGLCSEPAGYVADRFGCYDDNQNMSSGVTSPVKEEVHKQQPSVSRAASHESRSSTVSSSNSASNSTRDTSPIATRLAGIFKNFPKF